MRCLAVKLPSHEVPPEPLRQAIIVRKYGPATSCLCWAHVVKVVVVNQVREVKVLLSRPGFVKELDIDEANQEFCGNGVAPEIITEVTFLRRRQSFILLSALGWLPGSPGRLAPLFPCPRGNSLPCKPTHFSGPAAPGRICEAVQVRLGLLGLQAVESVEGLIDKHGENFPRNDQAGREGGKPGGSLSPGLPKILLLRHRGKGFRTS